MLTAKTISVYLLYLFLQELLRDLQTGEVVFIATSEEINLQTMQG